VIAEKAKTASSGFRIASHCNFSARRARLNAEHVRKDLRRMIARIHLVIDPRKLAVLIDQETHAARISRLAIRTGAVRHSHAPVGIAKQRKRKVVFLGKVGILLDVIEADAEDLNIVLVEVANLIAEPASLGRSAGGISLGIEPEDDFASTQFRECDLLALMTREHEVRRRFANLKHYSGSSWAAALKNYTL
jgi:hypothetical protein